MNIRVGKYAITSDPLNYILNEVRVRSKDGKGGSMGDEYLVPIGYYSFTRIDQLLKSVAEKEVRKSQAEDIDTLLEDIKGALDLIDEAILKFKEEIKHAQV